MSIKQNKYSIERQAEFPKVGDIVPLRVVLAIRGQ